MVLALPPLGRYSLKSYVQERMKTKFVKKTIKTFWDGGRIVCWKLPNGKLRSPNDGQPARIEYIEGWPTRYYEEWYKDGKYHRENDQPARIVYHENGSKRYEGWYKDDEPHRENDQPAYIGY